MTINPFPQQQNSSISSTEDSGITISFQVLMNGKDSISIPNKQSSLNDKSIDSDEETHENLLQPFDIRKIVFKIKNRRQKQHRHCQGNKSKVNKQTVLLTTIPDQFSSPDSSLVPSCRSSSDPTFAPIPAPSFTLSSNPSSTPSFDPGFEPSSDSNKFPSSTSSYDPTSTPSYESSSEPSFVPTPGPTSDSNFVLGPHPNSEPSSDPSLGPSPSPWESSLSVVYLGIRRDINLISGIKDDDETA